MEEISALFHIREQELKGKGDSFEKTFQFDQDVMKEVSVQIHNRVERLKKRKE